MDKRSCYKCCTGGRRLEAWRLGAGDLVGVKAILRLQMARILNKRLILFVFCVHH